MKTGTPPVIFLLLFLLLNLPGFAQLQPVYSFQKDDTVLRKKYYEQALQKKKDLLQSMGKENAKDYKEIYEDQYKQIGLFLQSTRTVTAPEPDKYLQSIVQKIIAANDELKGLDMRVVFSRDWWPNAYSMGEGTISINAGLMIFLDNEAELVFVLCHELSHYYLNHSTKAIKKYVETINSDAYQKELKRLSKQEFNVNRQLEKLVRSIAFDSRRHSRENEAEADRQAFTFMKRTGYDCGAIKTSLSVLDVIDDSLIYQPAVPGQVFNFAESPFKTKWIAKESAIFSQLNENDSPLTKKERDSLKSHPDCAIRILLLEDSIAKTPATGQRFLIDENEFRLLKKQFFVEMTEECYREDNLGRNLYYSLMLLQAKENIPMAVYSIARCLNEIYESQKAHRLGTMIDTENKKYREEYNLLLRMLNRLRLDEIAELNYYFCRSYQSQMQGYAGFEEEMSKAKNRLNF